MDSKREDGLLERRASELVKSVLDSLRGMVIGAPQPDSQQHDYEIRNIDWVAGKDFNVSVGKTQIAEYMGTWEIDPRLLFSVKFLQECELEFERQFLYRALWSIPTYSCPVPKHTAAVYFTIAISKIKPLTTPVQVRYQVEFSKTVHIPGKTRFREKWLKDVIESKALLMDTITF